MRPTKLKKFYLRHLLKRTNKLHESWFGTLKNDVHTASANSSQLKDDAWKPL
jgi:hypothetical protein